MAETPIRPGNIGVAQLPLGDAKFGRTVDYLGVEVDGALVIGEQIDV